MQLSTLGCFPFLIQLFLYDLLSVYDSMCALELLTQLVHCLWWITTTLVVHCTVLSYSFNWCIIFFGLLLKNGSLSTLEFLVQMIRSCRLMLLMTNDALISYGFTLQNLIQFILLAYFYGMVHFFRLNYLQELVHFSVLNYFTFLILPVEHFHSTGKKQFMRQLPCFHTQTFQSADEEGDDWAYALCERSPTFLLRKEQTLPSLPEYAILGRGRLGTS